MTIEEKLELHSTITSLPISDDKLHRINELMDKAYDEMEQKGREKAVEECQQIVQGYFNELIHNNPEWEIDSIDDFALIPNKEICNRLEQMKEQNGNSNSK